MKKLLDYLFDNSKRPSTHIGIILLVIGFVIFFHPDIVHDFLGTLVKDPTFIGLIVTVISGYLMGHRQKE